MQPQRETTTDSLADIIQIINIGFKNGTLSVERNAGEIVEEGYIVFVNGRAVEANVGQYSGVAAFNYLNTWQLCRFSFIGKTSAVLQPAQSSLPKDGSTSATDAFADDTVGPIYQNGESNTHYQKSAAQSTFPVRLQAGEAMLQYPDPTQLSRTHRRLLLLVNGQRSVSELTRLMVRSLGEVWTLLDDLEHAGLIRQ
jgi:hypothetical protein